MLDVARVPHRLRSHAYTTEHVGGGWTYFFLTRGDFILDRSALHFLIRLFTSTNDI